MKAFSFVFVEGTVPKGKKHIWSSVEDATVKTFFNAYIDDVSESGNKGKLQGSLYVIKWYF